MSEELEVDFGDDPLVEESFENAIPVKPAAKPETRLVPSGAPPSTNGSRVMPHSLEAEANLIACALVDSEDTFRKCDEVNLAADWYYDPKHQIAWEALQDLRRRKSPIDVSTLAEELIRKKQLDKVGGYGFVMQVSGQVSTTAQVDYWIGRVREQYALRRLIREASTIAEYAYSHTGDVDALLSHARKSMEAVETNTRPVVRGTRRGIFEFDLIPNNHPSVLLGKRFLNRGDILTISSTSGMGKSSMALQLAVSFAHGVPAFGPNGIPGNGKLTSLVIQSEDGDGDVAEVAAGMLHGFNLTEAEKADINSRVVVITDRTNRGERFIAALRRHIEEVKPDLVFINPLQAFMDGDITDSKDCGRFLRDGLNGLNEPATHAYVLIHHTTKPSKEVKGVSSPKWNEQMYEMAGGAEIINASRAIAILKASDTEGFFNLVLAKRGRRAGATRKKPVQDGVTFHAVPVTTIPLKYSTEWIEGPDGKMPAIFWETREPDVEDKTAPKSAGRPSQHDFADFRSVFPPAAGDGLEFNQLARALIQAVPIPKTTLFYALKRWVKENHVEVLPGKDGKPPRYRITRV